MAIGVTSDPTLAAGEMTKRNYTVPLALMVSLYFGIGFITALNDILIPHFKDLFHLTNVKALMVQLCFFGAYFVMSLPSGSIVGKIGYKRGIVVALTVMGIGLLLFLPASMIIFYPLFLFALFIVGSGLALLQVAINPYVGALGAPETAAARLNLCGFLNSFATTIAPKIGAAFIFIAAGASAAELARSVRMPYVILAGCAFAMAVLTAFVDLPKLLEGGSGSGDSSYAGALRFKHLRLGALAIFFYVGAEVAIGSVMINFLGQPSMGGLSHEAAAKYVSLYWGGAMCGRLIGFFAMQKIRARPALVFVSSIASLLIVMGILMHGHVAMWAIVACGLFNSVMWPCIFPMSVEGLGRFTSHGSGILIMMVVGGAIIPEVQGLLADKLGYQPSFAIVLLCYLYILFFALRGHRNLNTVEATESLNAGVIQ
jgi:FHS family L-fucose permease-like MFS transporter